MVVVVRTSFQVAIGSEWSPPVVSRRGIFTGGTISHFDSDGRSRKTRTKGETILSEAEFTNQPKKTACTPVIMTVIMTNHYWK